MVDIDVPGNNGLPVQLARVFNVEDKTGHLDNIVGYNDWEMDVPYIDGTFFQAIGWKVGSGSGSTARCSNTFPPASFDHSKTEKIWHGYNLNIPGVTSGVLLKNDKSGVPQPTDSLTYPWITDSGFRIRCLPLLASGHAGEGFLAVGPDGTKYWFDWMVARQAPPIRWPMSADFNAHFDRERIFLMATRVEDRHGNWVTYTWSGSKLTQINSSDNRQILITWSGNQIASATSHSRTWTYQYTAVAPPATGSLLTRVVLPDGSDWTYSRSGSLAAGEFQWEPVLEEASGTCTPPGPPGQIFNMTVKHPAGATAVYEFLSTRIYRTDVPFICERDPNSVHEERAS